MGRVPVRRGAALLLALALCALLAPAPAGAVTSVGRPFADAGSWVSIFSGDAVWDHPREHVARMHRAGVHTLFLQTASSSSPVGSQVYRPTQVARFLQAAHARGMRVVAWYLPPLRDVGREYRRAMAAVDFRTPGGQRFDAFALDIEPSATHSAWCAAGRQPAPAQQPPAHRCRPDLQARCDRAVADRAVAGAEVLAGLPLRHHRPLLRRGAADELLDLPGQRCHRDLRLHDGQHRVPALGARADRVAARDRRQRRRSPDGSRPARSCRPATTPGSPAPACGTTRRTATRTGRRWQPSGCDGHSAASSASLVTTFQLRAVAAPTLLAGRLAGQLAVVHALRAARGRSPCRAPRPRPARSRRRRCRAARRPVAPSRGTPRGSARCRWPCP